MATVEPTMVVDITVGTVGVLVLGVLVELAVAVAAVVVVVAVVAVVVVAPLATASREQPEVLAGGQEQGLPARRIGAPPLPEATAAHSLAVGMQVSVVVSVVGLEALLLVVSGVAAMAAVGLSNGGSGHPRTVDKGQAAVLSSLFGPHTPMSQLALPR